MTSDLPPYDESETRPPSYHGGEGLVFARLELAILSGLRFEARPLDDYVFLGPFHDDPTGDLNRFVEAFQGEYGVLEKSWITIVVRRGHWPTDGRRHKVIYSRPSLGISRMTRLGQGKFWQGFYTVVVNSSALTHAARERVAGAPLASLSRTYERKVPEAFPLELFRGRGETYGIFVRDSELRRIVAKPHLG